MKEELIRTGRLIGENGIECLNRARVIVFGIGGVGGYCTEALARSGVGALTLVDSDTVSLSNINRQIIALHSTVGRFKTEVMAERIADINPDCKVTVYNCFLDASNLNDFELNSYDYVVDCIDTVTSKLLLAEYCHKQGIRLIASMGAGNKLNAEGFTARDITQTSGCPLARVMRRELRKRGIEHLKVVATDTLPMTPLEIEEDKPEISAQTNENMSCDLVVENAESLNADAKIQVDKGFCVKKRVTPGSIAYVPSVAGLIVAQAVINDLCGLE